MSLPDALLTLAQSFDVSVRPGTDPSRFSVSLISPSAGDPLQVGLLETVTQIQNADLSIVWRLKDVRFKERNVDGGRFDVAIDPDVSIIFRERPARLFARCLDRHLKPTEIDSPSFAGLKNDRFASWFTHDESTLGGPDFCDSAWREDKPRARPRPPNSGISGGAAAGPGARSAVQQAGQPLLVRSGGIAHQNPVRPPSIRVACLPTPP
jgi:hypothetical protein